MSDTQTQPTDVQATETTPVTPATKQTNTVEDTTSTPVGTTGTNTDSATNADAAIQAQVEQRQVRLKDAAERMNKTAAQITVDLKLIALPVYVDNSLQGPREYLGEIRFAEATDQDVEVANKVLAKDAIVNVETPADSGNAITQA